MKQIFNLASLNEIHTQIRFREKYIEQPRLRNRSISASLVDFHYFFLEETFSSLLYQSIGVLIEPSDWSS